MSHIVDDSRVFVALNKKRLTDQVTITTPIDHKKGVHSITFWTNSIASGTAAQILIASKNAGKATFNHLNYCARSRPYRVEKTAPLTGSIAARLKKAVPVSSEFAKQWLAANPANGR